MEELILFPSIEYEAMQCLAFDDLDYCILALGETIEFSDVFANPDHEGQNIEGKLESCRE